MAISNTNQTQIAFKNLVGRSMTSDVLQISDEAYGIGFEVQAKDVTIDKISATSSAVTVQNGLAIQVKATLTLDASSGGKGYVAFWPSSLSGNILVQSPIGDPKTTAPFKYASW